LSEELQLHIDLQMEDNIRAGMMPEEARRAARLKFGAIESIKESYRDERGALLLESLIADLRYAVRQLRRTPGFTVTAVVTIALGIGANTAIYSVMNTVMWKPLPIPEPDRLIALTQTSLSDDGQSNDNASASPAQFAFWRTHLNGVEDVAAFLRTAVNFTGGDAVESFACMALLLATVGTYGVMSYSVQQRTPEIGIRIALGAETSQVRNMVVRYGVVLTFAGVIIGVSAAWELALLMQSLVFGVKPRDPIVFILAPLALSAVALLAVWIPATRASRVNPVESLRQG
jgi:FtsX-like permease family protein